MNALSLSDAVHICRPVHLPYQPQDKLNPQIARTGPVMLKTAGLDPDFYLIASELAQIMMRRANALFAAAPPSLYYFEGVHSVHVSAPSPAYVEIVRIDGAAWDCSNFATLFNDIVDAMRAFHTTRAAILLIQQPAQRIDLRV